MAGGNSQIVASRESQRSSIQKIAAADGNMIQMQSARYNIQLSEGGIQVGKSGQGSAHVMSMPQTEDQQMDYFLD